MKDTGGKDPTKRIDTNPSHIQLYDAYDPRLSHENKVWVKSICELKVPQFYEILYLINQVLEHPDWSKDGSKSKEEEKAEEETQEEEKVEEEKQEENIQPFQEVLDEFFRVWENMIKRNKIKSVKQGLETAEENKESSSYQNDSLNEGIFLNAKLKEKNPFDDLRNYMTEEGIVSIEDNRPHLYKIFDT